MELHNLTDQTRPNKKRKRVGIGEGSGRGKTSTRGQKGQKARSGGSIRHGFESGHIPLYRKLPQRGFNNKNFRTDYSIVNLASLSGIKSDTIGKDELVKGGLVRPNAKLIKVLGVGDLKRAVTITADKFSASAKQKIESAGGKAIVREPQPAEATADAPEAKAQEPAGE